VVLSSLLQLVPVIENKSAEASNMAFPNIFFIVLLLGCVLRLNAFAFKIVFGCKSREKRKKQQIDLRQK